MPGNVSSCRFTPDSAGLIDVDSNGLLTVWDVNTGKIKFTRTLNTHLAGQFIGGGKAVAANDGFGVKLWDTQQLLGAEKPLPRASFYWFDGGKWLVTTPQGYFDCSSGLDDILKWNADGKMYPYQQFEQQYHKPELVRQALKF